MKKLLTIIFAFGICIYTANAQQGEKGVSVGVDIGLPLGNMGDAAGIGFGGSAKGYYGLNDESDITLQIGYMKFSEKDNFGVSYSFLPVLAGYRYKFDNLYVEPQLGFTSVKTKIDMGDAGGFLGGSISGSTTNLGYAAGVGYLINQLDLGLKFQGISASGGSLSIIAFRAAYNFSF